MRSGKKGFIILFHVNIRVYAYSAHIPFENFIYEYFIKCMPEWKF